MKNYNGEITVESDVGQGQQIYHELSRWRREGEVKMKETILVIEDEKLMRVTIEDSLKASGYSVIACENGADGLAAFKERACDVVVTDIRLPDKNGIEILREIAASSDVPVIVMTAFGTIKDAVEAMKLGAFDYITKPFSLDEFRMLIERALEMKRLREDNIRLRKDINRYFCFPNIIGESAAMKKVFSTDREGCGLGFDGLDPRRERDRQGADRDDHSLSEQARRTSRSSRSTARPCRRP